MPSDNIPSACSDHCVSGTFALSVYAGNLSWSVTDRDLHDVRAATSSNA